VDQGGEAGHEDDAAELPPVPVERGPALAERDRVQSGEPVAAAGAAPEDRQLVLNHLAAATGDDGRSAGEARPLLLAAVGRRTSDAAPVRSDGVADDGVARASGVGEAPTVTDFSDEARGEKEECWRHRSKERQLQAFALSGVVKLAPFVGAGGSEGTGHLP